MEGNEIHGKQADMKNEERKLAGKVARSRIQRPYGI